MRIKSLFLLFFSFVFNYLFAAPNINNPDSLRRVLISNGADTAKALAAYALSEYCVRHDSIEHAWQYIKVGKNWGKASPMWSAISGYYEGLIAETQDHSKAEKIYLTTENKLQAFSTQTAYYYRAVCWYNYGVQQQYKDDQKGFLDIVLSKALPLAEKSGDNVFIGKTYWGLGVVFKNTLQYDLSEANLIKAIDYFLKAQAIYPNLIKAYTTIAETYILEKKYTSANNVLQEAYAYLKKDAQNSTNDLWIDYYTAQGMYCTVTKNYPASIKNITTGIALAEKIGNSYKKGRLIMQLFYANYESKNYDQAIEALNQMVQDTVLMKLEVNRLQVYDGYAQTFADKKDFSNAFNWQKKYSLLSDSVYESKLKSDISAMEVKFKTSENEKRITSLESAQKSAKLTTQNKNNLIVFLSVTCVLLLALTYLGWSSYTKKKNLNKQREMFHLLELQQKEQDIQLESVRALLEGEEKERSRLARDLHDGLGGMLASLKLKLSHIADENNWLTNNKELSKISDPIDETLQELRRISRNMVSPTLMRFGLEAAINDLCQSYSLHKVSIEFQPINISTTITDGDQLMIYRIVQELLANALKHANATTILLQCSQNNNLFLITFEDNGIGFDQSKLNSNGIGLLNIEHRVHFMDGKIDHTSAPGKGTFFNIELKLKKQ